MGWRGVNFLLIFYLLVSGCSSVRRNAEGKASLRSEGKWELIWNDEFDYEGLPDENRWGYDAGGGGWGNNEQQFYTAYDPETARVSNGMLIIEAHKKWYLGMPYKSARIVSRGKGDFLYGRIEVCAKLPTGRGVWPAIWMLPTDSKYGGWPSGGEIDIMEMVGHHENWIHMSIHTEEFNHRKGTQKTTAEYIENAVSEFHVYGIEWYPDKIDFFIDDKIYMTFDKLSNDYKVWPFDQKFYLIMNIAVGGDWGAAKGVDNSIFPQQMEIDYVRVYKLKN